MITLTPSQDEDRKRLLISLEKDLKKFEYKLNHKTLEKIKSKINKHIKISICKGRIIAPFAIALGITLGGSMIIGHTPFYIDKEKNNLKIMEEISSTGNIRYEEQYEPFENTDNTITFYDYWHESDNHMFSRNIKIYNIGSIDKEKIEKILKNKNEDLESLFGSPVINKTEIKDYISFTENFQYLEAKIYSEENNKTLYINQQISTNIIETVLWLLITFILEVLVLSFRDVFPINYKEIKEKIEKNDINYLNNLEKKFEIRKSNYERLTKYHSKNILNYENTNSEEIIYSYLNPQKNNYLSTLNGEELQKVVLLLDELTIKLRDSLELKKENTFGIEIEVEKANIDKIIEEFQKNYKELDLNRLFSKDTVEWTLKYDGSLDRGLEIVSNPLFDEKVKWNQIKEMCELINPWCEIGKNSSLHVHIGAHILGDNTESWLNFCAFWSTYENIIYRFLYGNFLTGRPSIVEYAHPISEDLWNDYEQLSKKKDLKLKDLIRKISYDKYKAINFLHVDYLKCNEYGNKNTVESRGANTSLEAPIIQNYINLLVKVFEYCKSKNFNIEIVTKRHELIKDKYNDIKWYDEIFLEQALEFSDLVFNKNIDKLYFLKQYLKYFELQKSGYYPESNLTNKKKIYE